MQPALAGNTGAPYQASSFGPVRTLVLDTTWQDLLGEWEYDLVEIRVPPESLRVLVIESDIDLAGTVATPTQEADAWVLDPGVHPKSVNRSSTGPRWYVAVDPTDGAGTVRTKIMAAG